MGGLQGGRASMWAFLKKRLARRRSEQSEIADRASQLIQSLVDAGYYEAREGARAAGCQGETVEARRWSNVAREIGSRRRMKTGLNGWDRIGLEPPKAIDLAPAADVGGSKAADQHSLARIKFIDSRGVRRQMIWDIQRRSGAEALVHLG